MLDPNFTILPQMLLFGMAMYLIHSLILKPYSDNLRSREGAVEGAKGGADTAGDQAEELKRSYEAQLDATRAEAEKTRAAAREIAHGKERSLLDEARAASDEALNSARAELRGQVEAARAGLDAEAAVIATQLAEAALGRSL